MLKILGVITELWQELITAPVLATLIKLNTAVTAIANIIKYHEVIEPLLFEENMTILGTLLNVKILTFFSSAPGAGRCLIITVNESAAGRADWRRVGSGCVWA